MTSITAAVFKAAVSLLINKGQDFQEQMREGNLTDPNFREFIVREIDVAMKGQERNRDLLAATSSFRQGIVHFFKLFEKEKSSDSSAERSNEVKSYQTLWCLK